MEKNDYATVSKIIGPIHVSGWEGAKAFNGDVLFVHHDIQWYSKGLHIPLLRKRPLSDQDRSGAEINPENLDLILKIIGKHYYEGRKLLVHCKGGVERAPLCVVQFLVDNNNNMPTLDDAYRHVIHQRSVVEDRREWLNGY